MSLIKMDNWREIVVLRRDKNGSFGGLRIRCWLGFGNTDSFVGYLGGGVEEGIFLGV